MKFEINVTKEDLATKKPLLTAVKRLFPTASTITQGEYHDLDCVDSYVAIDVFSHAGFISIYVKPHYLKLTVPYTIEVEI